MQVYERVVRCVAEGCDGARGFRTTTSTMVAPGDWTRSAAGFVCPLHPNPEEDHDV
jgi:hypothetical protein